MTPHDQDISPFTGFVSGIIHGILDSISRLKMRLPVYQDIRVLESEGNCDLPGDDTFEAASSVPTALDQHATVVPPHRQAMIEVLSDSTLLEIFGYYRMSSSSNWPMFAHVCRRWRSIVFASHRRLDLQLYCTPGTRVSMALKCWPPLPIVVKYGTPSPKDENHTVAVLTHSDGVSSISPTVVSSLLKNLGKTKPEEPFPELEELVLLSRDITDVVLPTDSETTWCSRLRRLHLARVNFATLSVLLSSSKNLVDIRLREVPNIESLSPEAFAGLLSGATQLQSLTLQHRSPVPHSRYMIPFPSTGSSQRVVLPALADLVFHGTSEFFDRFLARIDSPLLQRVTFNQTNLATSESKLSDFVDQMDVQTRMSHRRADIIYSERAFSICITKPGSPMCLKVEVPYAPSDRAPHIFKSRIFSACIARVEDLRIVTTRMSSARPGDDWDVEKWFDLIYQFRSVKWLHLAGDHLTNVICAFQVSHMRPERLLLALHKLYVRELEPHYAPLRGAVTSFVRSRWASGYFIVVEYEGSSTNDPCGTAPSSQRVTAEMLSEDVLLNIFRHYLHTSPRFWTTLVRVSTRWRRVVFSSPLGLGLRLHCTYGSSVLKGLELWPFPIVVNYGGYTELVPRNEDNVVAALKQSNRVSSICLVVTNLLLKKLSTISEPFSGLQDLVLLSDYNLQLTLPSSFRWGAHLRRLQLTRITIPSLPELFLHSQALTDLELNEIPYAGYFSSEAFANALSGMTQLRSLSLHFFSLPLRLNLFASPPPSGERVILPALTCFKYRGTSKYLDCLLARIDAPRLEDFRIKSYGEPTMDASQLGLFIDRIEKQRLHSRADIVASDRVVSISFTQPGAPTRLYLQMLSDEFGRRLASMVQLCKHFSPFLFRIEYLRVKTQPPSWRNNMNNQTWLDLIRVFGGVKVLDVSGKGVIDMFGAFRLADREEPILPALCELRIPELRSAGGHLWKAAKSFIVPRWSSGTFIQSSTFPVICGLEDNRNLYFCAFCDVGFVLRGMFEVHACRPTYTSLCAIPVGKDVLSHIPKTSAPTLSTQSTVQVSTSSIPFPS